MTTTKLQLTDQDVLIILIHTAVAVQVGLLTARRRRVSQTFHKRRDICRSAGPTPVQVGVTRTGFNAGRNLIALDEALAQLAETDKAKADLVKLRYFAGLTLEQAADALGISRATASRHWVFARAWLYHEITKDGGVEGA